MSRENGLMRRLKAGEAALCMPIRISRSAHVLHMARAAGFDSVYVDMEQSDVSIEAVGCLCQAAWGAGVTPLVRVPALDPHVVGRVLDGGAGGVIVPHVEGPDMAAQAVELVRFPPRGQRSGAGAGLALRYAGKNAEEQLDRETMLIVMIELPGAVDAADAIAGIDGVDMLFVGAGDLSRQLGVHGDHAHPKIRDAFARVAEACRRHGKTLGVGGIKGARAAQTLSDLHCMGARFISARTDEALLAAAASDEAETLRRIFAS